MDESIDLISCMNELGKDLITDNIEKDLPVKMCDNAPHFLQWLALDVVLTAASIGGYIRKLLENIR